MPHPIFHLSVSLPRYVSFPQYVDRYYTHDYFRFLGIFGTALVGRGTRGLHRIMELPRMIEPFTAPSFGLLLTALMTT